MAKVLAVGISTLDIVNVLERYPEEDEELRALDQQIRRGGNATNTLCVLSQLGHRCSWAGTLAEEPDARLIEVDLARHAIDTRYVQRAAHGKVPTSYISLSRRSGSRTIVHYRDLDEYDAAAFNAIDLGAFDWVHFEGRNIEATAQMLLRLKAERPRLRCSLEIEKPRPGIEALIPHADLLLFSKGYARAQGFNEGEAFLRAQRTLNEQALLVCAWGEDGAHALGGDQTPLAVPAVIPAQILDSVGAGDVFNAGIIDALLHECTLHDALQAAVRLAGKKCGQYGLDGLSG